MKKARMFTFTRRVLGNLFKKPATTGYPFEPAVYPERMRGHVELQVEDCIFCGLCMRSCPSQAIEVDRKTGTWRIQRFDCVQCGSCVSACPRKCLAMVTGYTAPGAEKTSDTYLRPEPEEKAAGSGDRE